MILNINRHGVTIAEAVSSLVGISLPCGGGGRCGGCGVKAYGELDDPSEAEQRLLVRYPKGWRLMCKALCMGKVTVELDDSKYCTLFDNAESFPPSTPLTKGKLGAAIDIGTTTIAAKLIETESGKVIATADMKNPQAIHGADVISRIEYSLNGGAGQLKNELCEGIFSILHSLTDDYIDTTVIVGNTTMLTTLLGDDVSGLAYAPFAVTRKFGEFINSREFGCEGKCGRFYIAPCISAFVGADMVSAILASDLLEYDSALLADIGTNGELALHRDRKLICTSTAAGPAFEGAEITCGMTAADGAVTAVKETPEGFSFETIGNLPPVGIAAGGLVSFAATLLESKKIDSGGYLECNVNLTENIYLTPADIRKLQAAKAAIKTGIDIITGGKPCDKIILAGGIGHYLNISDAVKIGLLPDYSLGRTLPIGNAALRGACMILQKESLVDTLNEISKSTEVIELDTHPQFGELYIENMSF